MCYVTLGDQQPMSLDSVLIAIVMVSSLAVANFIGVPFEHIWFYVVMGFLINGYKIVKNREKKTHEIAATFMLSVFMAVVVAPSVELKLELSPTSTAVIMGILILAGEAGLFYIGKKLFGIDLDPSALRDAEIEKTNDKDPESANKEIK